MGLQIDFKYLLSLTGAIRVAQVILGIVVLICISCADITPKEGSFVYFVASASLINSLVVVILYVLHFPELGPLSRVPWVLLELVYAAIWTLFYFISGCICINLAVKYKSGDVAGLNIAPPYGAAAFFAWCAVVAYGIDAFLNYRKWRTVGSTSAASGSHNAASAASSTAAKY